MVRFTRPSGSVFAYCKRSKTGAEEGLGTRLQCTTCRATYITTTVYNLQDHIHCSYSVQPAGPHTLQLQCTTCRTTYITTTVYNLQDHIHCSYSVQPAGPHTLQLQCITCRTTYIAATVYNLQDHKRYPSYVDVMVLNRSCPAVSQICSFTFSPFTSIVLILKSTPIVVIYVPVKRYIW